MESAENNRDYGTVSSGLVKTNRYENTASMRCFLIRRQKETASTAKPEGEYFVRKTCKFFFYPLINVNVVKVSSSPIILLVDFILWL